ncbi:MAG: RHS repeat-associated core domain-containing protein, partial [Acidimicrobiales bacterium]
LMYYGARYYDPTLARFISADTITPGGGAIALNRYAYANNNPAVGTDPTGHACVRIDYEGCTPTGRPVTSSSGSGKVKSASIGGGGGSGSGGGDRGDTTPAVPDYITVNWGFGVITQFSWCAPEHDCEGAGQSTVSAYADREFVILEALNYDACADPTSWGCALLVAETAAMVLPPVGASAKVAGRLASGIGRILRLGKGVAPQTLGSGVRGLANAGDELAQGGVYALRDPVTGQVVRTGRTNSLLRRQGEHFRDPRLSDYEFEVVARTDVYAQRRGLEQLVHDAYNPALNRINPISATNPNRAWYLSEAEQFLARYGGGG